MGNKALNWQKSIHGSVIAKHIFATQKESVGDPSPLGMKLYFLNKFHDNFCI